MLLYSSGLWSPCASCGVHACVPKKSCLALVACLAEPCMLEQGLERSGVPRFLVCCTIALPCLHAFLKFWAQSGGGRRYKVTTVFLGCSC